MARTKHTDRKEPNRPPQATKSFVCDVCQKEFGQSTNYNRHLGLVHRLNRDGSAIDGATYAKYAAYSQRGKRQPKAAELAGSVSTTESTVARPKKTRKPRSRKHQFVQNDSSSSSDEFWVVVSEAEADYEDESASYAEPVVMQNTAIVCRTFLQATSNILLLNNNSAPLIYSDAAGTRPDHLLGAAWLLQI